MTARLLQCTPAEYHADPCPVPSLSSHIAHTIINRSPLHAWNEHPRLGGVQRAPTKEMDRGSLVHELLLGTGPGIVVVQAKDFRTKAAQEERDAAYAEGKVPVLEKNYEGIRTTVQILEKKIADFGITFAGQSEVAITWTEESLVLDEPVHCRAMLDHLDQGRRQIVDLKTCDSAHPRSCASHAISYGYLVQHAAHTTAAGAVYPKLAGRLDMIFVFCETEPPYAVTPVRLDGQLREIGGMNWRRAVETWGQCLQSRKWPPYAQEILTLEAPAYLLSRELGGVA